MIVISDSENTVSRRLNLRDVLGVFTPSTIEPSPPLSRGDLGGRVRLSDKIVVESFA
jgi:hypothetical protein